MILALLVFFSIISSVILAIVISKKNNDPENYKGSLMDGNLGNKPLDFSGNHNPEGQEKKEFDVMDLFFWIS